MKKKITRPDGTVEEWEGTADELRKLEETSRDDERKDEGTKGRRILNEEDVTRLMGELVEWFKTHSFKMCGCCTHHCHNSFCMICNPPQWTFTTTPIIDPNTKFYVGDPIVPNTQIISDRLEDYSGNTITIGVKA